MGILSFLFGGGGSGGGDDLEFLGSDTSYSSGDVETLFKGLDDRDKTIAELEKKSKFQHEIIVGALDQVHQHEIDRYEIVKKISSGVADKFYTPGRCEPFPEIDFVAEVKAEKTHSQIHGARHSQQPQTDANDPWLRVLGGD